MGEPESRAGPPLSVTLPVIFTQAARSEVIDAQDCLFFRIESDALVVIACFHSSRDPKHWQRRVHG